MKQDCRNEMPLPLDEQIKNAKAEVESGESGSSDPEQRERGPIEPGNPPAYEKKKGNRDDGR